MKYYNDNDNQAGSNVLFMIFQIFMLLIVYGFVYTSFIAVKLAIAKYDLTVMTYLPELISFIVYPVVLYKTRQMFRQAKRLRVAAWVMGWAAVIIVFLYAHLSQLITV
ncbi:MAG: hypothetical protein J7J02_06995 [Sulfurovum sp.]|nr:hypothetical protein [Sulfurovum sp.]